MIGNLLLHTSVDTFAKAIVSNPPQGILFVGPEGIGKRSLAEALAIELVDHPTSIRIVSPDDKGTIAIETIRELYKTTRAKQSGRQVVVIEAADRMSLEAENAFLKLLEEPRAGLTFMLTALHHDSLLPTILSRLQHISLQPLPNETLRRFIVSKKPGIAESDLSQIIFLAQGRPGTALNLLSEGTLPKQRERMQLIKQLLSAKQHERFILATKFASSRDETLETLQALSRVIEAQLTSANTPKAARQWTHMAEVVEDAQQAISHNGNVKAQLLYLFSRY